MRKVDANGGVGGRLDWPAGARYGESLGSPTANSLARPGNGVRRARRGNSSRTFRFGGGVRLAVVAGILGCVVFAVMSDFGRRAAVVKPLWPSVERLASRVGLGIDQVSVTGHHHTSESDVFDALRLDEQRSFLSFDSDDALLRLQKLSWVKSASLVRVLPGRLEVEIVEREAFAVWQRGEDLFLIDARGRVLSALDRRYAPNLPFVLGEGAALEVAPLMRLIAASKFVSARLLRAHRVSRRRWTLALTGGVTLHLPAQGAASALALVRTHRRLRDLILRPDTVVDLRVSGRAFVRTGSGGATSVLLMSPSVDRSTRGPG